MNAHALWTGTLTAPLVLASASPRRTWILSQLGLVHTTDPADLDEEAYSAPDPSGLVAALAQAKALAVAPRHPGHLVLGSDTLVWLDGQQLGKPRDPGEAIRTLSRLAGRTHEVWTGVALVAPDGSVETRSVVSRVRFRTLSSSEIEAYVATGDPLDKAGSYGIQGPGLGLVESIEGCFYAVAGLPVAATLELLRLHRNPTA